MFDFEKEGCLLYVMPPNPFHLINDDVLFGHFKEPVPQKVLWGIVIMGVNKFNDCISSRPFVARMPIDEFFQIADNALPTEQKDTSGLLSTGTEPVNPFIVVSATPTKESVLNFSQLQSLMSNLAPAPNYISGHLPYGSDSTNAPEYAPFSAGFSLQPTVVAPQYTSQIASNMDISDFVSRMDFFAKF